MQGARPLGLRHTQPMPPPERDAVLITGVYGTGKSSVAAEMADLLERARVRFAAIDLDWLAWANLDDGHGEPGRQLMLANLRPVVGNYVAAGMTRFVLAGWIDDRAHQEGLRDALSMPTRVVRLEVPFEEIERRLGADPTSGREDDLRVAREALAAATGSHADLAIANDRPIREVAIEIITWLGWA